ncbi:MAG: NUDIX hydrolase [Acidimicrobiales bacterium]
MSLYQHGESVDDPSQVKVRNAATVMIVADRPDLHVLMVQRTSKAAFGPRAWVFPGGRVDADDGAEVAHVVTGLTDAAASEMVEVPSGGLAWWLAGIRETLEEAGLLLGAAGAEPAAVDRVRKAVHDDAGSLIPALAENEIVVDLGSLHEVGRFVTPVGPPRRFDTRFFVGLAPDEQIAHHDESEIVEHQWMRPGEAIERSRNDEIELMAVTHRMLACLARYPSAAEVMAAAERRGPAQRVRINDPDGRYEVLMPGEPGYDTAEVEIKHGAVRL